MFGYLQIFIIELFHFKLKYKALDHHDLLYPLLYPEQSDFGTIKEGSKFALYAFDKRCK